VHDRFIQSSSDLRASLEWGIDELIETGVSVGLIGLASQGDGVGASNTGRRYSCVLYTVLKGIINHCLLKAP
jgi:hypothetical protein